MNANEILFHPSALGDLMTGVAKGWDVDKSLTCKRKLIEIFRQIKYDRYYSHSNKYTEKGTKMEEDGISLYCKVKGIFVKKNKERIKNEWFNGEPDIIFPKETVDIKCSWSLQTLPHVAVGSIGKGYEYQGRAYMDLCPGA